MSENKTGHNAEKQSQTTKTTASGGKALLQQLAKPFSFLILLIMICAFLAHYLTGSETLEEYAQNHTDAAYESQNENTDAANTGNPATDNTDDKKISAGTTDNSPSYDITGNVAQNETAEHAQTTTEPEKSEEEQEEMIENPDRTVYQQGFYYEPLSEEVKSRITGISYPVAESRASETAVPAVNLIADAVTPAVSYDDLRYLSVLHYDFNGEIQTGELICNKNLAQDFVEIFYELYRNEYRIERIRLIDEYNGDDTASMADNNTSCFNYRVVDGTTSLSKHALGCAIDVNPFYNPYVVYNKDNTGSTYISPPGSEAYEDRSQNFPYKIDENDLCYHLFKEHGFTWGGDWNSSKDYQHFQKVPD